MMLFIKSILYQLASYSPISWAVFIAIAFCAARFLGRRFVIPGHLIVAALVVALDLIWIEGEMHKPGGLVNYDRDFVFMIGVLSRILLINTTLLPVTALGIILRDHHANPTDPTHPTHPTDSAN